MSAEITLHETKWLGLYRIGRWDFVRRPNSTSCVAILAIAPDDTVVLIEQFRVPVGKYVIEIPAGLVGDEPEFAAETLSQTASRELLEETGYRATSISSILSSPTSSGMSSEITHLFLATGLIRESQGGGTAGEQISVHHVPIATLRSFLDSKAATGLLVDFKIHAALAAAGISF